MDYEVLVILSVGEALIEENFERREERELLILKQSTLPIVSKVCEIQATNNDLKVQCDYIF